jgi:O-antigen/teichoic acid export membrane protein
MRRTAHTASAGNPDAARRNPGISRASSSGLARGTIPASILWLAGERVATTLVVFASNLLVIRYLGAERFGHLALFQVVLALLMVCMDFGLRRVFLSLGGARALPLVGAATWRIKAGLALLLSAALGAAVVWGPAGPEYLLLLGLFVAAPLDIYLYRFEAHLRNDLLVRIRVGLALAMALLRVALCWRGADLAVIAATFVAPPLLLNLCVAVLWHRLEGPKSAPARGGNEARPRARLRTIEGHVLRRALWGFGAVLLLQLGLRSDQLLLSQLGGPQELGWYASAYKFIEQITLLATMVNGILLPALSRRGEAETRARLQSIYFATLVASIGSAAVLGGAAGFIVNAAFGPGFAPAAPVLSILALAIPGVAMALVGTLYYSLAGADAQLMLRALAGLALSVVANLLLIPRYGAVGAAWAVVVSQSLIAFGVDSLTAATRPNNVLKWRAVAALVSIPDYRRLLAACGSGLRPRSDAGARAALSPNPSVQSVDEVDI